MPAHAYDFHQHLEKYKKSEVGFEHPAKGDEFCRDCVHFEVLKHHGCEIVEGLILPGDWCREYKEKK